MILLADFTPLIPEYGQMFWTTLVFILVWLVLGKLAFKPITEALKTREDEIQDAIDSAVTTKAEMAKLQAENQVILAQAQEEKSSILKDARDAKNQILDEAKSQAKAEAAKIVASAKVELENQKNAAMAEVKKEVGSMALEIAEKVIQKELSGNAEHKSLVDKLVADIKLN